MDKRISDLETRMKARRDGANAELVARVQRAEAELGSRKPGKK